jgi:hypothetical protein
MWTMQGVIVAPKPPRIDGEDLVLGTWANVHLEPSPKVVVTVEFVSDNADASFRLSATRDGNRCALESAWPPAPEGASQGPACPLRFTNDGISMFVPDIGEHSGQLIVGGYVEAEVTSCVGTAECRLERTGLYRGGLNAKVATRARR